MLTSLQYQAHTGHYRLRAGALLVTLSTTELQQLALELQAVTESDFVFLPGFGPRVIAQIGNQLHSISPAEHQALTDIIQQELLLLQAQRLLRCHSPKLSR